MHEHIKLVRAEVVFSNLGLACDQSAFEKYTQTPVQADAITLRLIAIKDKSIAWIEAASVRIAALEARAFALARELDEVAMSYAMLDESAFREEEVRTATVLTLAA